MFLLWMSNDQLVEVKLEEYIQKIKKTIFSEWNKTPGANYQWFETYQ